MIPIIPYSHYYRVGGRPNTYQYAAKLMVCQVPEQVTEGLPSCDLGFRAWSIRISEIVVPWRPPNPKPYTLNLETPGMHQDYDYGLLCIT